MAGTHPGDTNYFEPVNRWFGCECGTTTTKVAAFTKSVARERAERIEETIRVCLRPKPRWMPFKLHARLVGWLLELDVVRRGPTVVIKQDEDGKVTMDVTIKGN